MAHAHTHARTHTCTHTRMHAHTRTHAHAHTHTHTHTAISVEDGVGTIRRSGVNSLMTQRGTYVTPVCVRLSVMAMWCVVSMAIISTNYLH